MFKKDILNGRKIKDKESSLSKVENLIELETYGAYDETTDNQESLFFKVPLNWLKEFTLNEFNQTVEEFLDSYIWDTSEIVLRQAEADGLIILN